MRPTVPWHALSCYGVELVCLPAILLSTGRVAAPATFSLIATASLHLYTVRSVRCNSSSHSICPFPFPYISPAALALAQPMPLYAGSLQGLAANQQHTARLATLVAGFARPPVSLRDFHASDVPCQLRRRGPLRGVTGLQRVALSARGGAGGVCLADVDQASQLSPRSTALQAADARQAPGSAHPVLDTAQLLQWPRPSACDDAEAITVPAPEDWHRHPALLSG